MNLLFILTVFNVIKTSRQGDCPLSGEVPLTSATISSLPSGCTSITGNVILNSTNLSADSLSSALGSVTSISGYLYIGNNPSLGSLDFLSSLTTVSGINSSQPATVQITNNPMLFWLGLPDLTTIIPTTSKDYSIKIFNMESLCLSDTELANFLNMENAYFMDLDLCGGSDNYCTVPGGVKTTKDLPDGCTQLNGYINLGVTSDIDVKKLAKLENVYGPIILSKTSKVSKLDMTNLNFIYNQYYQQYPAISISNTSLTSFTTPKLTKISNRVTGNVKADILFDNNQSIELNNAQCTAWAYVGRLATSDNKGNCGNITTTPATMPTTTIMTTSSIITTTVIVTTTASADTSTAANVTDSSPAPTGNSPSSTNDSRFSFFLAFNIFSIAQIIDI